jgi:flagellar FliJ protein
VQTPPFTFSLERVRSLRTQAEDRAREELANELSLRVRGEALLRQAAAAAATARETSRSTARGGASGTELLAAQAWIERSHRHQQDAALDLDRRDAEVAARRDALMHAARERKSIDKLAERRRTEHDRAWASRSQGELDEIALTMHRRATGGVR